MVIKINKGKTFSEDVFLNRFNRQIKIPGWTEKEQKKIFNKRTLIVGDDLMGEMVLAGLVSFGARNLFYYDYQDKANEKSYFSNVKEPGKRLEKIIKTVSKINPHSKIYAYHSPFTKMFINLEGFEPEIIIDATNDLESKEIILDYLDSKKETKLISGISNPYSCAVSFYNPSIGNYQDILNPKIDVAPFLQGGFTSNIATALIIEEFRKSIFGLNKEDKNSIETIYYNINSATLNSPENDQRIDYFSKDYKILLAGCGGIGNYAALSLIQEGFKNISFLDMDTVEDTNLNRQMFFYEDVGQKKNVSLSNKLNKVFNIRQNILSGELDDSCGELFEKNKYDLVLGCFDNANARIFLNDHSVKYGVPYIDGGTTYESGQIRTYIPGKTACIKCKRGLEIEEEKTDNSCDNSLPSVISPNMIIGSIMVGEAINYFSGNFYDRRIIYNTHNKKKINSYPEKITLDKCSLGNNKNERY
jgi:molybdopterin/thiamine biosynthesis adenylyltransferase